MPNIQPITNDIICYLRLMFVCKTTIATITTTTTIATATATLLLQELLNNGSGYLNTYTNTLIQIEIPIIIRTEMKTIVKLPLNSIINDSDCYNYNYNYNYNNNNIILEDHVILSFRSSLVVVVLLSI